MAPISKFKKNIFVYIATFRNHHKNEPVYFRREDNFNAQVTL